MKTGMKSVMSKDLLNSRPSCLRPEQVQRVFGNNKRLTAMQIATLGVRAKDRFWILACYPFLPDTQRDLLGCYIAETVLPIFEKAHPADERPRQAIETKRAWIHGEATDDEVFATWTGTYNSRAHTSGGKARAAAEAAHAVTFTFRSGPALCDAARAAARAELYDISYFNYSPVSEAVWRRYLDMLMWYIEKNAA